MGVLKAKFNRFLHRLRVAACATRLRLPKPLVEAPAI